MAAALLIMGSHNSALAAPAYPPVQPSQTHRVPSHGVKAIESHRAAPAKQHSTNSDSSLSETGFATLTATTVAVALFAGGAIFLGLGRRRRHI